MCCKPSHKPVPSPEFYARLYQYHIRPSCSRAAHSRTQARQPPPGCQTWPSEEASVSCVSNSRLGHNWCQWGSSHFLGWKGVTKILKHTHTTYHQLQMRLPWCRDSLVQKLYHFFYIARNLCVKTLQAKLLCSLAHHEGAFTESKRWMLWWLWFVCKRGSEICGFKK